MTVAKRKPVELPATKQDLEEMRSAIRTEMDRRMERLETAIRHDIAALNAKVDDRFNGLEARLNGRLEALRGELLTVIRER